MNVRARGLVALLGSLAIFAPTTARAQGRELKWPAVTVVARLDSTGRLHVAERQVMRFTGDWNGGERSFNVRMGQKLSLDRLGRVDPTTNQIRTLSANDDLSNVDDFKWAESNTLRWRSRLPEDPPFDNTDITYLLEYTFENILKLNPDSTFLLDHDFAFSDRVGDIDNFDLVLTLDPPWRAPAGFTGRYKATAIPPGNSFVVTIPLTFTGAGRPSAVIFPLDASTRNAIAFLFTIGLIVIIAAFVRSQTALGRFAPLVPLKDITPYWLEKYVFVHRPEVAGAAWDNSTSAPEVAATLARLVQEKKIVSKVETQSVWIFKNNVLHLTLNVPRSQFQTYERELVDALFFSGSDKTDTKSVRKHYRSSGFDPAGLIRGSLDAIVENTTPGEKGKKPSRRRTLILLAIAIVLLVLGVIERPSQIVWTIALLMFTVPTFFFASIVAYAFRNVLSGLARWGWLMFVPLVPLIGVYVVFVLGQDRFTMTAFTIAGIGVWLLAVANSVLNIAKSRQSPERIAVRKQLASAREFFRAELKKKDPKLLDEWFPYLIGFGLGPHIDKWFRAFGKEMSDSVSTMRSASSSSTSYSSTSSGSSGWSGFGGGGGFAGAGASAAFATAVGGMAASVAAPSSSSSSSGGSSGGGSSGGGGGGGW